MEGLPWWRWLRVCLPMQGTWVRALVWEDPTCRGATRPVSHNCWACASGACALQQERPRQWEGRDSERAVTVRGPRTAMKSGSHSPQLEKALAQKRRPNTAKNKQTNKQTKQPNGNPIRREPTTKDNNQMWPKWSQFFKPINTRGNRLLSTKHFL